MTAKQYLRQLPQIEVRIRRLSDEILERRTKLTSMSLPTLGDKVQTSPGGDRFADMIASLADRELYLAEMIDIYRALRDKIVDQIMDLDDAVQADVLYQRYVQGRQWQEIADATHYSIQHIFRIHGNALVAFAVKYLK